MIAYKFHWSEEWFLLHTAYAHNPDTQYRQMYQIGTEFMRPIEHAEEVVSLYTLKTIKDRHACTTGDTIGFNTFKYIARHGRIVGGTELCNLILLSKK